jgi:beta-glucosidase
MNPRAVVLAVASLALFVPTAAHAAGSCGAHPWCNTKLAAARRASMVLAAMTTAEKLGLVASGSSGVPRLGIPPLRFIDGPNGIGEASTGVTAFPDAETIAASWDRTVASAYGQALGAEAAGKGDTLLAAPTINILRTSLWGREAETLGEDPFLTGSLVAPEIRGIQSRHVIAEVKHYAGNNQEIDRFGQPLGAPAVSDQVSERTLQEIYLPGFKAAVQQGRVGSVMCSYNRINTVYSCQNPESLGTLKRFGLRGFVGPDASLAVRDDVAAVNAGVDNMQLGSITTATGGNELTILTNAYGAGKISPARLGDAARRILTAMFEVGLFNHRPSGGTNRNVSTPAHLALATRVAEQATVLLRNRGRVLPLSPRLGSIAVIGHDAGPGTQIEENGSPAVRHGPVISPLSGIRRLVGSRSRIAYAPGTLGVVPLPVIPSSALSPAAGSGHGLSAKYYSGQTPTGSPVATRVDSTVNFASQPVPLATIPRTPSANAGVWTGALSPPKTGLYRFSLRVSGVAQLYLGGRRIIDANAEFYTGGLPGGIVSSPGAPAITFQGLVRLTKGHPVSIRVTYATGSSIAGAALQVGWQPPRPSMLAAAVHAARHAKVAIVFANDVSSEGMDRASLRLPGDQDRLIEAVAAANPHTIVVLHTAGPVLMPWLAKVTGVLEAWYPGQRSGAAIAATLFGRSDPSGHLPVTFPRNGSQGPTANRPERYPGVDNVAHYSEGVLVGYRYYDRFGQRPLFPFGYGLSYTAFSLRHLSVKRRGDGYRATVTLRNTGHMAGAEVVQAYLGFPAAAGEPPRQLKAFAKKFVAPGGVSTVSLSLPRSAFEYWNARRSGWTVAPGRYRLYVGTSSRDLPLGATIRVR